eukprot:4013679-Prorocentrum_lima.AAC.1
MEFKVYGCDGKEAPVANHDGPGRCYNTVKVQVVIRVESVISMCHMKSFYLLPKVTHGVNSPSIAGSSRAETMLLSDM